MEAGRPRHSFGAMRIKRLSFVLVPAVLAAAGLAGCKSDDAGSGGSPSSAPSASESAPAGPVEQGLNDLVASGVLVGGEAVLQTGTGTESFTAGLGDRETGAPYPEGGHTRVASVTKAFTSSMVLQLVEEGLLDLDGTIEDYLPGLLTSEDIEPDVITVRQLLRHESGLPELEEPDDPAATYTPGELLALIGSQGAQYPPGDEMRYTNTNYVLAGMLIEKVTGHRYADELKTRIADPLGLTGTYLPEPGDRALKAPAPKGYMDVDGVLTDVTAQEPSALYASGGIVSNGADLNRFFAALLAGEVVAPESLDAMRETVPMTDVPGVEYGLGIMHLPVSCEVEAWGQAGDVPGFQAMVATTGDRTVSLLLDQSPSEKLGPGQLLGLLDAALC